MKTGKIVAICCAAMAGLALGNASWPVNMWWLAPLGLLVVIATWWRRELVIAPLVVMGLVLGLWRGGGAAHEADQWRALVGSRVVVSGQIIDDPATAGSQVRFNLGDVHLSGLWGSRRVPGHLQITSYRIVVQRGYRVGLAGRLSPGFGTASASLSFAQATVLSTQQNWLERWRQAFFAATRTALPDPLAGFALGILIGARSLIPTWLQSQLTTVGLSHLTAVSGYNLTIIIVAVYAALRRQSKYLATATSLWLTLGFVVLAGASASVVRAAIVGVLGLWAGYYGRRFHPMTLIALAAVATGWYQPSYIAHDVGWQLSFLAFFGILVLAPLVEQRVIRREHWAKSLIIESLCAQIMTFPIIMLVFGQFSVVAPLANLIILPLVPLAMLASFLSGLGGLLASGPLAFISTVLAWPAWLMLRLIIAIIMWLSTWPAAAITASLTPQLATIGYVLLTLIPLVLARRSARLREKMV